MKKLILIDGHSILNRAYYGLPELTNSAGLHTNAVYGFLTIMFRILEEEKADYLAVAMDLSAPTFRHKEYKEYKGKRKPMPDALVEQIPVIKELLSAMTIPIITKEGYEADDIIGTLSKRFEKEGLDVTVLSGDRDLLQLADKNIKISIPKTSKGRTEVKNYYPKDVLDEYKVTPLEFIDLKALMGDASDNIPGVPSIGAKTATDIIVNYHSIEEAYQHVDELKPPRACKALKEHYDKAVFSKWLVTIKLDVPIDIKLEDMDIDKIYTPQAYQYMKHLEFKTLIKKFDTSITESDSLEIDTVFKKISDFLEAELIFSKVLKSREVGMELILKDSNIEALSICIDKDEAFVIVCEGFISSEYLVDQAKKIADNLEKVYVLNLKPILKIIGTETKTNLYDMGVASYLLNPLKDTYHADDIARDYLSITIPSKEDLLGKKDLADALIEEGATLNLIDEPNNNHKDCISAAVKLAGYQSLIARLAGNILLEKLSNEDMKSLYMNIEIPLIYSLARMENIGIKVDAIKLKEYSDGLIERISKLEKEIYLDTQIEFNINSPKQLGEILFEKLQLPGGKKTKTGYSTAADVLDKLAPEYPVVKKVLEYRQLSKLNSTYAVGLASYIQEDSRIRGTFNQTITATGRISSTEPNLQNIPIRTELGSRLRDVFVPKDGYVFVDADYSQVELRVLASMSDDEELIDAYKNADDIHTITASKVFHIPFEEVTPIMRRNAKAVNFGVVYGISAFGLSEGLSISRKEALEYINNYFKTYPKVKQFLDSTIKSGKEQGYVTTMFGRRRPIPEFKSSNFMQRAFGERIAMNSPIQGTAADIMKIAMINVDIKLRESPYDAKIVLQIHDELLIETKKDDALKVLELVIETMKHAAKLKVELEVDAHIGDTWLAAK